MVLGAKVEEACRSASDLLAAAPAFRGERYILTYRPDTKKVYVVLKQGAETVDCLKAAFACHTFLHLLDGHPLPPRVAAPPHLLRAVKDAAAATASAQHGQWLLTCSWTVVDALYGDFTRQAAACGWQLKQTMLNPRETRLLKVASLEL